MALRAGVVGRIYGGLGGAVGRVAGEPRRWLGELEQRAARLERRLAVGRAHVDARIRLRLLRVRIGALRRLERAAAAAVAPLPVVTRREFARVDRQVAQLARELRELEQL